MTHEELVKAVAQALEPEWYGVLGSVLSNYPGQDLKMQQRAEKLARAAIATIYAAMSPATATMIRATQGHLAHEQDVFLGSDGTRKVCCAMIAASPLNPEKPHAD